jgi:hypothetical protein
MRQMREKIKAILERQPGLKAKAIADQLRLDKTEVNQVLYANKNLFVRDEAFAWSLSELRVNLGSLRWLNADLFEDALLVSGSPLDSTACCVTFVIGEGCKPLLEALARLLAICNQLVSSGKSVSLDFSASKSTLSYLNRIGFIDLLHEHVQILPKRPKRSTAATYEGNNDGVVELRRIDHIDPDNDIPTLLRRSFVSCVGDSYDVAAHTVLSELYGNVTEHSEAQTAGFAGLQYYAKGIPPHIQTVISDNGRGIVGTLMPVVAQRYPSVARKISASKEPQVELLKEVFSTGGISQVDESGRGLGLKRSGQFATKYNAIISVRQETFALTAKYKGSKLDFTHRTNLARIAGTHICFDFVLDQSAPPA